ncbi:MAG TPA: HEAT repeat domain-containing protein [Tepidisphaeraceae bacterium]|nr:HEAT repeat domain-containing protein [Tepidisphaeraceae bacterium]
MALIVLAAITAGTSSRAGAQSPAPATATSARQDIEQLSAILSDVQSSQDQRDEAARRLLSRQSKESRAILRDALTNSNQPSGQIAVAKALVDDIQPPDETLIDPLFMALNGSRPLPELAARALSNYKTYREVWVGLSTNVQKRPPVPEAVRRECIRALGAFPEKQAAETLIGVLKSPEEGALIRTAAANALADLTGITDYGQDTRRWNEWWTRNLPRPDQDFQREMLLKRAARYDQLRQRYADVGTALENDLKQEYQSTPAEQRPDMLLKLFKKPEPEIRAIAAGIVQDDILLDNKRPTAAVREQLRQLIGDSNAKVRIAVAQALAPINDASAMEPLLTQLAQENDGEVRAALAKALAQVNDVRIVRPMIELLKDPYSGAVVEAAKAIEAKGPLIQPDPALAQETAEALRRTLAANPPISGNNELREALVDAMVPLKQESLLDSTLYPLLDRRGESDEMRRVTLKAIGMIGNQQSAALVVSFLGDRNAEVRLVAVSALGNLPNASIYVETLRGRLSVEKDTSIIERIWSVINDSILPKLTKEQLANLADADQIRNEPKRRISVLKELERRLQQPGSEDELATERQNIAMTLMNDPNASNDSFKEAADYLKLALDYKKTQNVPPVVIVDLMENRMKALLRARQYHDAVAFATESITTNDSNEPSMGGAIRQEAEILYKSGKADDLDNVLKLITEVRQMKKPLSAQFLNPLDQIESDVRNRLRQRGLNPSGPMPTPQSAAIPSTLPISTASGR